MKKIFLSNIFFIIMLVVSVFAVYGKSVGFELTNLDDDSLTIRNIDFISDYRNIPKQFTTDCYFGMGSAYYRPVLTLSFSLESILFGYNTKVYHITNILLFILDLYLIFIFVRKLIQNTETEKTNDTAEMILKCLILLFAVHPVLASVPVWLPARNDSLLTLFFISSLIFFINYLKTNKNIYFFFYIFFYAVSLITKETAVLLIFVYPLLIYCFNFKISKRQIYLNSLTILILMFFYFILRKNAEISEVPISFYIENYRMYFKNFFFGTASYIKYFIFPDYMPLMISRLHLGWQTVILNLIFFALTFILFIKEKTKRKIIFFIFSFFFISIFTTFLQQEYTLLFHRLIITLPAVLIFFILFTEKVISHLPVTKKYIVLSFILMIMLFTYCSFNHTDKYKDAFTLWYNAYNDAPEYHIACDGLAKEYCKKKEFDKAVEMELKAINIKESYNYYKNYAEILFEAQRYNESENIFNQLLKHDEKHPGIYKRLSKIFLIKNDISKAVEYAKKAVELSSKKSEKNAMYDNLAWVYSVTGEYNKALNILFKLAEEDKKNKYTYYFNISMLYEDLNNNDKAYEYIRKAAELKPDNLIYQQHLKLLQDKVKET